MGTESPASEGQPHKALHGTHHACMRLMRHFTHALDGMCHACGGKAESTAMMARALGVSSLLPLTGHVTLDFVPSSHDEAD